MKDKPIKSEPPSDAIKRFVLGKEGSNCLLVICLNPSTADINGLDGTTENIEEIAVAHGYDGWLLFNLSAQRSTKPEGMHYSPMDPLQTDNALAFMSIVDNESYGIKDVLFAWGNNIESRNYLATAAREFMELTLESGLNPLHIRLTQKGHPYHPSFQALGRFGGASAVELTPFNVNEYLENLKKQ
jgi:hypothetical protein